MTKTVRLNSSKVEFKKGDETHKYTVEKYGTDATVTYDTMKAESLLKFHTMGLLRSL